MTDPTTPEVLDRREERAVRALRAVLDPLPSIAEPASTPGRGRRYRALGPRLVAAAASLLAVLVLLSALTARPWTSPAGGDDPVVIPDHFPGYRHLTASMEQSPPGPALFSFTHGAGVELMDFPQSVVLGADGATYRRSNTAALASIPSDQGDPGPSALSPDGRWLAVGSYGTAGSLALISLVDGGVSTLQIAPDHSVLPTAWGTGSRSIYLTVTPGEINRHSGSPALGPFRLVRADLADDGKTLASPPVDVINELVHEPTVAPLPGGEQILVTRDTPSGRQAVELRTRDGALVDGDLGLKGALIPGAVSPDGSRVILLGSSWAVHPLGGGSEGNSAEIVKPPPSPLEEPLSPVGWLDQDRVLLQGFDNETWNLRLHLYSYDLRTQRLRQISIAEPGWTGAAVYLDSVASELLLQSEERPATPPDYGTGALVVRFAAWAVGLGLLGAGMKWLSRREMLSRLRR